MNKSDAKPGTKVLATYAGAFEEYEYETEEQIVAYHYNDGDYGELVGVIRSKEASPGCVWVKWIEGDGLDSLDEEEMEVDLKLLVLASDKDSIEDDFKKVAKEIKEKMKEAGKLVKEANSMAKRAHLGSLASLFEATGPLVDAMDNAGWRSSSWGC